MEDVKMPQNEWIKGALLIPENNTYKVDSSGRIVIPSYLRSKFRIEAGDQIEYFTSFIDDSWFLCVRLDAKTQAERALAAMEEAAAAMEEITAAIEETKGE
jgi:AbrB family looped-hinge helix DNA binding protein